MRSALCFALLLLGCATPRPRSAPVERLTYRVAYDPAGQVLHVRLELPPSGQPHFSFTVPWGEVPLEVSLADGSTRTLSTDAAGELTLPEGARQVRYRYPLTRGDGFVSGVVTEDGAIVAGRAYLLRPRRADPNRSVQLYVDAARVQLPWALDAYAENGVLFLDGYLIRETDLVDSGFHTFGGRTCLANAGDDARLLVTVLGAPAQIGDEGVCSWIAQAMREVLTIRRNFPFPRVALTVVTTASREASPFGMMLWSDPPSLALYAGRDADDAAFERDWVAVHELLHLTHPTFLRRATWLSEGLATYLTEVARMRSGRKTPEEGWMELADGFRRGAEEAQGRTLAALDGSREYLGYYWGGALVVLEVDVAIRRATGGRRSLDDVLELLATRGISSSPEAFGEAVDEVAGAKVWEAIAPRRLAAPATEGATELLERLGVRTTNGHIVLDSSAPDAAHRIAITHGKRRR